MCAAGADAAVCESKMIFYVLYNHIQPKECGSNSERNYVGVCGVVMYALVCVGAWVYCMCALHMCV